VSAPPDRARSPRLLVYGGIAAALLVVFVISRLWDASRYDHEREAARASAPSRAAVASADVPTTLAVDVVVPVVLSSAGEQRARIAAALRVPSGIDETTLPCATGGADGTVLEIQPACGWETLDALFASRARLEPLRLAGFAEVRCAFASGVSLFLDATRAPAAALTFRSSSQAGPRLNAAVATPRPSLVCFQSSGSGGFGGAVCSRSLAGCLERQQDASSSGLAPGQCTDTTRLWCYQTRGSNIQCALSEARCEGARDHDYRDAREPGPACYRRWAL